MWHLFPNMYMKKLPEYVNPNVGSGIEACVINELRLRHPQCRRHPIEKLDVGFGVQVEEFFDQSPRTRGASSDPLEVPFGKVDSVVERLKPYQSKGHEKAQCRQYIDGRRYCYILKGRHFQLLAPANSHSKRRSNRGRRRWWNRGNAPMHMHDEPVCALGVAFWDSVNWNWKFGQRGMRLGFFFSFSFVDQMFGNGKQNWERFDGANKVGGMFGLAALTLVYVTAYIWICSLTQLPLLFIFYVFFVLKKNTYLF